MIDNATLPSPYIISVLLDYYDERPETILVDISKLDPDFGFRRAVVDALNESDNMIEVSYDTLQSEYDDAIVRGNKVGIVINGTVTLTESGSNTMTYDGYTVPEDWDEEDLANFKAEEAAEAAQTIKANDRRWIAQMYHGPVGQYDAEFLAKRFNTDVPTILACAAEFPPEEPAPDIMGGLSSLFGDR